MWRTTNFSEINSNSFPAFSVNDPKFVNQKPPPPSIIELFELVKSNQLAGNKKFLLEIASKKEYLPYILDLAMLCAKNEKVNDAILIFESLRFKIKKDEKILFNLGLLYSLKGDYQNAIKYYDSAIQIKPHDVTSIINKSQLLIQIKKYNEANKCLDDSIRIDANFPEAWSNKGIALNHLGLYSEALIAFNQAIKLNSNFFEAYANRALSFLKLKKYPEALNSCNKSIQIEPNYDGLLNKAIALNELKRYDEAIDTFNAALKINPYSAKAHYGKGVAFSHLEKNNDAINEFHKALAIDSNYLEARLSKAFALNKIKKYAEALENFDKALLINNDLPEIYYGKAVSYNGLLQIQKSLLFFDLALKLKPNFNLARWAKVFTLIPAVLSPEDNIKIIRESFFTELKKLSSNLLEYEEISSEEIFEIVASTQPFYLAYQNFNNKNILSTYGGLCSKLMHKAIDIKSIRTQNSARSKIKFGIISSHFRNHSVWHAITKGFLKNLNRSIFEIHLFSTNSYCDEETNYAKDNCNSYTNYICEIKSLAQEIVNKELDFLYYPEIGMHQPTAQLASLRLAPVQFMGWGHPESSGLPTIDYFVSSELFEPVNSDNNYCEKLLKLPNLGTHYVSVLNTKSENGVTPLQISLDLPILICPGTPYKYQPETDWIFSEIAKNMGTCRFIFFNLEDPLADILRNRLEIQFSKVGLDSKDFISFMPWLSPYDFHCLMKSSAVMLDSLHFSGFNTVMQALECDLPVITYEGNFLRGRLGSGILKRIGLTEMIAKNENEYVQLTCKLLKDKHFYKSVKDKVIKHKFILYGDTKPVEAFEKFMIDQLSNL